MRRFPLIAGLFLLAACSSHKAAEFSAPEESKNVQVVQGPDGRSLQYSFAVEASQGSPAAILAVDSKVLSLGYRRCDRNADSWEKIVVRKNNVAHTLTRALRFYRSGENRVATMYGEEACKSESCTQQFTVKFVDLPRGLPGRDEYLAGVCS
jgi:hypothetical protein